MNPDLARLQPYPFEKLRTLFAGVEPDSRYVPISLHIGEPKHPTPELVTRALTDALPRLALYPATAGTAELRGAITGWLCRRYGIESIDPITQVLPVNGSREALFAIAQVIIDPRRRGPLVACPNPFYQIYEGAALLAGAEPYYLNMPASSGFVAGYASVSSEIWARIQLLYACSPSNPSGRVMTLPEWSRLFDLSDQFGFVIASDECYSELYYDEARPPLGALQAAAMLGRKDFRNLMVFSSLSKRSNAPGLRSGFVAGDAGLLKSFLLYRTYHGSAMSPPFQAASVAAWNDEAHVVENRRLYADKFSSVLPLLKAPLETTMPEGGFYLWVRTPVADTEFARELLRAYNVSVLPGSFLARTAHGENPGEGYVRLALVASLNECREAAERIARFSQQL
ncbi:MAG: succinyldiaminopimelate transaminase [Betaproteobacteria bacterium]|nr:succinyldiaminopimelate transaminase [Betaproteobacteria bacterium]